ncbi:MAG: long-chain-acyl-CoA synthetase, partial [Pseudomonadota bacterium]|nr:long-chain-acyl-CoA synthetase [Pseudomonadota bacterium]
IEFLESVIALNKIGATGGLINTNLRGRPLTHCISITDSKKCIFGAELVEAIQEVKGELNLDEGSDYLFVPDGNLDTVPNWARNLRDESVGAGTENLPITQEVTLGDNAFYIFTSGTTGLPKAAVLSNRRYLQSAMLSHTAGLQCDRSDRLYICLPLYHGTGLLIGAGASFSSGAAMVIRRRFSASRFLPEVREHGVTCLIYVGELCRYLVNSERYADDHDSPLRAMMGNGLRPDVWLEFKERFGISRISEFYGSSEGNVAFANLFNKDCTIGTTTARIALVAYDVDADEVLRDKTGQCIPVARGEPGLCIGHINPETPFEGYTDKEATEKKIFRNVFEEGDAWFNTGDLIRELTQEEVGFALGYAHYQFVDRVGDTFRWKSENVSTNEVGEIINGFAAIELSNVYGVEVPGADGRAGMVAVRLADHADDLDWERFAAYVNSELPAYARPVFVRVQKDMDVTGTFKMVKGDLRRDAYDLGAITDPVYVLKPGTNRYEPLDTEYLEIIRDGRAGY